MTFTEGKEKSNEPAIVTTPPPAEAAEGSDRIDLPITGMTCAACARRVERKLSKSPGVHYANVNFATSRATV